MTTTGITLRRFEDADIEEVLEVMRLALGESAVLERTPELFAWKHIGNPFGRSIVLVAEADGRIAGLRAFMRWELDTRNGDRLRCVRAVDTATHPDYQRRGIFKALTLAAVEEAAGDDVDLIFNTPNPKSGAGYLKMGWTEVGTVGVLAMPGRGVFGGKVPDDTLPAIGDYLEDARPANDLTIVDRGARGLRTPRTNAYLAWRFGSHPTARYYRVDVTGGTAIIRPNVRTGRRELVLSDVFGSRPASAIGAVARRNRAAYLAGWFSAGSPERSAAARRGMLAIPKVTTLTLVARPLRELPVDVSSLEAWDIASSDLELL